MTPTFTTRAEASAPPTHLVELMAQAAWDVERAGTSLPPLDDVLPVHAEKIRRGQAAAILAAEAAGYRVVRPDHGLARDHAPSTSAAMPKSTAPCHPSQPECPHG